MFNTYISLKDCILSTMICVSIILFNGCISVPFPNSQALSKQNKFVNQKNIENDKPPDKTEEPLTEENTTINPPSTEQGSGYLSEGTSLGMGIMDGDEELLVLKKIRRLEARLEAEKNKVKTLNDKLSKLQTAKEDIEENFAVTKKELEEKNIELLDKIKSFEPKLKEFEARATTAEQKLSSVMKELLKAQIIETKAQQELYKLKIDNLEQGKE